MNSHKKPSGITKTDLLSEQLNALRISGGVVLNEGYDAPWSIAVPNGAVLAGMLDLPKGTQAVPFHLVHQGNFELLSNDDARTALVADENEMVICFGGDAHNIGQGKLSNAVPLGEVLTAPHPRLALVNSSETARLICGVFFLKNTFLNPLYASLPNYMKLSLNSEENAGYLNGIREQLIRELADQSDGREFVIERLLELLCAESIRHCVHNINTQSLGVFSGLKDPVICQALSSIHQKPESQWTVELLADQVNLSASRFASRFSEVMGKSPMAYVTEWRVYLACCQLHETENSIGMIAQEVGYDNPTAFNRAFRKHTGVSPSIWRRQTREALAAC